MFPDDDDDSVDLNLLPDDDFDDLFSGFDDDPYAAESGVAPDDEDMDDDFDDDEPAVDEKGRTRSWGDIIKSWFTPKARLAFNKLKMKKMSLKSARKIQHDKLKAKAKQLGKLSLALLALKFMMDHHSDEINREDIKELESLRKNAKQKKSKGKPQNAMLLSLGSLKKKEANKVLSDMNNTLKASGSAIQGVRKAVNANYSLGSKSQYTSWLDKLANDLGFNPPKIRQSFDSMISTLKSWF